MPNPQQLRRNSGVLGRSLGSMRSWQSRRSPYETPGIIMKNNSGGALHDGDVVIVDPTDDRAVTTIAVAGSDHPLVVLTGADADENIRCYPTGYVAIVSCTGAAISPGDLIITAAVVGLGQAIGLAIPYGILGVALTTTTGVGIEEVAVLLANDVRRIAAFVQPASPAATWAGQLWVDTSV